MKRIAFDGTSATTILLDSSTGAVLEDAKLYNEAQPTESVEAAKVNSPGFNNDHAVFCEAIVAFSSRLYQIALQHHIKAFHLSESVKLRDEAWHCGILEPLRMCLTSAVGLHRPCQVKGTHMFQSIHSHYAMTAPSSYLRRCTYYTLYI